MSTATYTASVHGSRGNALRAYVRDIAAELTGDERIIVVIRRPGDVIEDDVRHDFANRADMHAAAAAITQTALDLSDSDE